LEHKFQKAYFKIVGCKSVLKNAILQNIIVTIFLRFASCDNYPRPNFDIAMLLTAIFSPVENIRKISAQSP